MPVSSIVASAIAALHADWDTTISANCSSGNCTFADTYHTLEFCSSCKDVSDQLLINIDPDQPEKPLQPYGLNFASIYNITSFDVDYARSHSIRFNATLPGAQNLTITDNGLINDTLFAQSYVDLHYPADPKLSLRVIAANHVFDQSPSGRQKYCPGMDPRYLASPWNCRGLGAAECSIYPCVNSYTAITRNGMTSETRSGSADHFGLDEDAKAYVMLDLACLTDEQRDLLRTSGFEANDSGAWLPLNHSINKHAGDWNKKPSDPGYNAALNQITEECLYQFDQSPVKGIFAWLSDFLTLKINPQTSSFDPNRLWNNGNTTFAEPNRPSPALCRASIGTYACLAIKQAWQSISAIFLTDYHPPRGG